MKNLYKSASELKCFIYFGIENFNKNIPETPHVSINLEELDKEVLGGPKNGKEALPERDLLSKTQIFIDQLDYDRARVNSMRNTQFSKLLSAQKVEEVVFTGKIKMSVSVQGAWIEMVDHFDKRFEAKAIQIKNGKKTLQINVL